MESKLFFYLGSTADAVLNGTSRQGSSRRKALEKSSNKISTSHSLQFLTWRYPVIMLICEQHSQCDGDGERYYCQRKSVTNYFRGDVKCRQCQRGHAGWDVFNDDNLVSLFEVEWIGQACAYNHLSKETLGKMIGTPTPHDQAQILLYNIRSPKAWKSKLLVGILRIYCKASCLNVQFYIESVIFIPKHNDAGDELVQPPGINNADLFKTILFIVPSCWDAIWCRAKADECQKQESKRLKQVIISTVLKLIVDKWNARSLTAW